MPPRIPLAQCLRAQNASSTPTNSRAFSCSAASHASTVTQRRKHRDPYAIAQAKARKAANLSRQQVLKKERASVLGDPVRGITTPFVRSFDTALPPEPSPPDAFTQARIDQSPVEGAAGAKTDIDDHLNFFLTKDELDTGVKRSQWLSQPLASESPAEPESTSLPSEDHGVDQSTRDPCGISSLLDSGTQAEVSRMFDELGQGRQAVSKSKDLGFSVARDFSDVLTPEMQQKKTKQDHDTAQEALRRISSLSLGSSKDKLRVNIQRCVSVFGRHNTDQSLPPKPPSTQTSDFQPEKFPRVGQDTGSSEVQIAILTAKIRTLADYLELRGHPDKVNKRNLRLLVHRRAKLLKYLRRKERGGPRWQNLIETLGLTDGTWKGEISM